MIAAAIALALTSVSAQAACPATAAEALAELGPSLRDHTLESGIFGPGLARYRTFHQPSLRKLDEPVAYAWASSNQARRTTEVAYRLGTGLWTVEAAPHVLSTPFRAAYPEAECEPAGCFATVGRRGAGLGELEGVDLAPVGRLIGSEGLTFIEADLATIDETRRRYPVVLKCRYRFTGADAPAPIAP